ARRGHLDRAAVAEALDLVRRGELDLDLARPSRVVRPHGLQVPQRALRAFLDQLARPQRRQVARAVAAEAGLHLHRRQCLAHERARLAAYRAVTGDEQHRTTPVAAEGRVDAGLANERAVEAQVLPRLAGDRVRENAVRRSGHGVHADEQRRVAPVLEELGVAGPPALHDELAAGVE